MKRIRKWSFLTITLILITNLLYSGKNYMNADAAPSEDYFFSIDGLKKLNDEEFEMTKAKVGVNITSAAGVDASITTITWESTDESIFTVAGTTGLKADLTRVGPGYATLKAYVTQGTISVELRCIIKVNLDIDKYMSKLTTTNIVNSEVLLLDAEINGVKQQKQIYLKYVNYEDADVGAVTGSAISGAAVHWSSNNIEVATVDPQSGMVTAVGAGKATIKVITNTASKGKPIEDTVDVVVKPKFELTLGVSPNSTTYISTESKAPYTPVKDVPSNFTIKSNAGHADTLKWVVSDSKGVIIKQSDKSKPTYWVSDESGNVVFENIKAGTYEITAFVDKYGKDSNVPYAYMKVIVPINVGNKYIVMNVGDTYNIATNSNIPSIKIYFDAATTDQNIAHYVNTGIITALSKGEVKLTLVYNPDHALYDQGGDITVDPVEFNIKVIDGISLSTRNATLYTGGTLQIVAESTNNSPITWTSSDNKYATVDGGLVKGIKDGNAIITATQIVDGVEKKATCKVIIKKSVTAITINPSTATIAIGKSLNMTATILPNDLNLDGVKLTWKTSNDKIASIFESSNLSATIVGEAGGNVVISAINQDNVVVGYCHVTVQQSVNRIDLSESAVSVALSTKQLQLRATVSPENAMNKKVNWTSSDLTKAKVDQNGLVTFIKPGTVTIIATSDDSPAVTKMCNITIQIPILALTLDETVKTMYAGETARLSYLVLPANASNNTVTWMSTNSSVATVDATGRVSAKNVGTTVIILKALDSGNSVYCTITVKRVATSVKLDVSTLKLNAGDFYILDATLTPADSTDINLVWESSDTKVATVDAKGRVVGKNAGTAIIMVRTQAGGIAYCKVTVQQPVEGLLLNHTEKTIYIKDTLELKVSVTPSKATDISVTWKSSNAKVATVSDKGVVKGLTGGTTVITCTTIDGGYSAVCVVTVRELVSSITIDKESYKLGLGKTVSLIATVSTQTTTNQDVTWTSSNEDVATVTKKGKVLGVSTGYATITATAKDGSDVEANCEIRVVRLTTSLSLSKNYAALLVGENLDLKATIKPSNATYKSAKWTTSDAKVAIVDDDGVITALKAGEATITAAAKDSSGKQAICFITVRDRVPATSITVMDKKAVMVTGEEKTIQVSIAPNNSTDKGNYIWSSDNVAVAKVDKKTGKITAKAIGTAIVTVMTDSGKTASIEVIVIGINFKELTLEQYTTYEYPLTVEGATTTVRWSIDNPSIATVTNGTVSSRAIGTATITAYVNGRKLTCKLKVVKIR